MKDCRAEDFADGEVFFFQAEDGIRDIGVTGVQTCALPISSRGQWIVSSSPGLFAAAHVLHRLLAPRHPPCALSLLIVKNTCVATMEFSRCARRPLHRHTS